jgi:hypothetical protein
MPELTVRLVALKDGRLTEITPDLKSLPLFHTAELVRCRQCSTRYWLLVEVSSLPIDPRWLDGFDITDAVHLLADRITIEHQMDHPTPRFNVPHWYDGPADQNEERRSHAHPC